MKNVKELSLGTKLGRDPSGDDPDRFILAANPSLFLENCNPADNF
jgi:hypothetical protein